MQKIPQTTKVELIHELQLMSIKLTCVLVESSAKMRLPFPARIQLHEMPKRLLCSALLSFGAILHICR